MAMEHYQHVIEEQLGAEEGQRYQALRSEESQLKRELKDLLREAQRGDNLFATYADIWYLQKPHGTLVYPTYFVWVFLGNKSLSPKDPQSLWPKIRQVLKDSKLQERLLNVDLRTVNGKMIEEVESLMHEQQDILTVQKLRQDSTAATYFFLWAQKIIEYYRLYSTIVQTSIEQTKLLLSRYGSQYCRLEALYISYLKKYDDA